MAGVVKSLGSLMGPAGVKGDSVDSAQVVGDALVVRVKNNATGVVTSVNAGDVRGREGAPGLPGVNGVLNDDANAANMVTPTKTRAAALGVARQATDQALYGSRLVNPLANPSFESGTAGWTAVSGTITRVTTPSEFSFADGAYVGLLTSNGTASLVDGISERVPVVAGQWVALRGAANGDAGVQSRLRILWRSSAGAILSTSDTPYVTAGTSGAVLEVVGQAPANAVAFDVAARAYSGSSAMLPNGAKMHIDAFWPAVASTETAARTAIASGYRDSNSAGWREVWTTNARFSESVSLYTTGNLDLYVSTTGDDRNDGRSGRPVRTIARLSQLIPDTIRGGHIVTCYVGANIDWNETLRPENKTVKGQLNFVGQGATPEDVRFNQVLPVDVKGYFRLYNMAVKERFSQAQFWFRDCDNVVVEDCVGMGESTSDINASGRIGFLADEGSTVRLTGSKTRATYKRYFARSQNNSEIYVDNVDQGLDATGKATNLIGLGARQGGSIRIVSGTAMPRGVLIDDSADGGGFVIGPTGFKSMLGRNEPGLVNQYTSINSPVRAKFYELRRPEVPSIPNFDASRRLRLHFDAALRAPEGTVMQTGGLIIEVEFHAQTSEAQDIYQRKIIRGNMNAAGAFVLQGTNLIAERFRADYTPDKTTVITAANNASVAGNFFVDVSPQTDTLPDQWGVKVSVTHTGIYAAPILLTATS